MKTSNKITLLIPCYNEEQGIGKVIKSVPARALEEKGYACEILVVDNNSSDRTSEVAREHGATVLFEPKKGKGNAIRTGFANIPEDTDFVVMLDGDDTYRPEEILRLIELLHSGFCTVVLGSRLYGKRSADSMRRLNLIGNYLYTFLVRHLYGVCVTDVLTGYYAWTRQAVVNLHPHLTSDGFTIEMEMVTKMAKLGEEMYSVPVSYHPRAGQSSLNPVTDGARIMRVLLQNMFWSPDAFSFWMLPRRKAKVPVTTT